MMNASEWGTWLFLGPLALFFIGLMIAGAISDFRRRNMGAREPEGYVPEPMSEWAKEMAKWEVVDPHDWP